MGKPRAKMKTSSAAKKRFKFTKSGKIKMNRAFGKHILTKKSSKRKRSIRKSIIASGANKKNLARLLPYG